ncbi:hypothetical protein Tco_0777000 [Tanacetum coccineum]
MPASLPPAARAFFPSLWILSHDSPASSPPSFTADCSHQEVFGFATPKSGAAGLVLAPKVRSGWVWGGLPPPTMGASWPSPPVKGELVLWRFRDSGSAAGWFGLQ